MKSLPLATKHRDQIANSQDHNYQRKPPSHAILAAFAFVICCRYRIFVTRFKINFSKFLADYLSVNTILTTSRGPSRIALRL